MKISDGMLLFSQAPVQCLSGREEEREREGGRPPLDIKCTRISPSISWDLILNPVWAGQDECERGVFQMLVLGGTPKPVMEALGLAKGKEKTGTGRVRKRTKGWCDKVIQATIQQLMLVQGRAGRALG